MSVRQNRRGPAVIAVRGASEHNLHHVDVDIPRHSLAVITGVSGSGKSSLAFDTIGAEGHRRYLETFSSYARQFLNRANRPAITSIDGLSPAITLDQGIGFRNPRSTVGTLTELYDLLRLAWARFGTVEDGGPPLALSRQLFSFNTPAGACPVCTGLGVEDRLDPDLLVADPAKTIRGGALRITTPTGYLVYSQVTIDVLDEVCRAHGFSVDVPWDDLSPAQRDVVLNGSDRVRIPYGKHPLASRLKWTGITARPREEGVYKGILPVMEQILRQKRNANILRFVRTLSCRACGGRRLGPDALRVHVAGRTIAEASALTVGELRSFVAAVRVPGFDAITTAVEARCAVIGTLGLEYLTIDREAGSLSAGEARRLTLARQATVGLGGLLYVLDEPSAGLHARDTERLLTVLQSLRDRGNTVLVVEHDEDTMRRADWIVDVGPGPGADGGRVLFSGPLSSLVDTSLTASPDSTGSATRAFLTGARRIPVPASRRPGRGTMTVSGLGARNLRNVSVPFRLGALNVVCGVSGAGKSTLVGEVCRLLGERAHEALRAAPAAPGDGRVECSTPIDKVIRIDQSPIGRTPRSNPATYTGMFDLIRDTYAAQPDAQERGFGKGRFSFNVEGGRCESCGGAGVQQFGMQFLGTVSVTCEACGGRRFNDDTLAIRHRGLSIHDVLDLPVTEAIAHFADLPPVTRVLRALDDLGLGYVRLGQPATTLSGGEAQRVKLATELARPAAPHTLYVLDEPTTGLHRADVARLLTALAGLVAKGHTVIVVEHHLDVMAAADWIVDLGPGSGPDGGRVVAAGEPEDVVKVPESVTAEVLGIRLAGGSSRLSRSLDTREPDDAIRFTDITTHNLRHLDVAIPVNALTVIAGVSGSGKSSLAFDTVFAEGQQRFAESMSAYARRFVRQRGEASFAEVSGLTASVAIRQQAPSRNPRSTVATMTEVHDAYRLLFSRTGERTCGACQDRMTPPVCASCGTRGSFALTAAAFSPNSEVGACAICHGLGHRMVCDPGRLITHPGRPLAAGAMEGHKPGRFYGDPKGQHMATLAAAAVACGLDVSPPWSALDPRARDLALNGTGPRVFEVAWAYERGARRGVHRFSAEWPGLLELVRREYERTHADRRGDAMAGLMRQAPCAHCGGAGLRPEALDVRVGGLRIHELLRMSVDDSLAFFNDLNTGSVSLASTARQAGALLRSDIVRRLTRLRDAGLGYLQMDRSSASLSSGEAQRVRIAASLDAGLCGVTYVLDEPTTGLHPRDTERLLGLMRALRDAGNTVLVVEHDLDVIRAADHLIELGPGAGVDGGRIVASGSVADVRDTARSPIGRHLRSTSSATLRDPRPLSPGVTIRGAAAHNLRAVDVDVPSGGLVVVTGVSGSGKSTLVFDVLGPAVRGVLGGANAVPGAWADVQVHAPLQQVIDVESARTLASAWSSPATQTGLADVLRDVFGASPDAKASGLRKKDFSAASPSGRCDACEGHGHTRVGLDFLPDAVWPCEACEGTGFRSEVLACRLAGLSIADVLALRAPGVRAFLESVSQPGRALRLASGALSALEDVGLGYLPVGQQVRTLSGGERQRLALAVALAGGLSGSALVLLDEPAAGLHADDVARLLAVCDRLIGAGHTVVAVEHDLTVIAAADWVIDLGPEGGSGGGRIVVAGTPAAVIVCGSSSTGHALRQRIERGGYFAGRL